MSGRNKPQQGYSRNQTFDSSGPDVKIRGSASQILERYLGLARDASSSGDRVAAESYLQHAEHYYRILNSAGEQGGLRPYGPNGGMRSTPNNPLHPEDQLDANEMAGDEGGPGQNGGGNGGANGNDGADDNGGGTDPLIPPDGTTPN